MTLAALFSALALAAGTEMAPPPPPPPPPPPAAVTPAAPAAAPVAPAPPAATVAVTPEKDPKALALVKKMCDALQGAKTFAFKFRTTLELPAGGVLATFFNKGAMEVARPDRLVVNRTGDLPEFTFAYDGKSMTASSPAAGRWGTTAAPPTIMAMLGAAAEQGDLSFPVDEMLVDDPYAALTKELLHAAVVGQTTYDGKKVDHLVLVTGGLELQIWLDQATSLPVREAIVYGDHPLRPHIAIDFSDWRVNHRVKEKAFALPMPKGATQVDFRTAAAAFR